MTSLSRSDRQLMRQRGSGLREIENVSFGLNVGEGSSREDRQLMRQRGAGTRKFDNIDFGLSFPTPVQSRRSSRTPRTPSTNSRHRSKTPATDQESRTVPSNTENRKTPSHQQRSTRTPQPVARTERPNSGKRRRLNKNEYETVPVDIRLDTSTTRQKQPSGTDFAVVGDEALDAQIEDQHVVVDGSVEPLSTRPDRMTSPLFVLAADDKENQHNDDVEVLGPLENDQHLSIDNLENTAEAGFDSTILHDIEKSIENVVTEVSLHDGHADREVESLEGGQISDQESFQIEALPPNHQHTARNDGDAIDRPLKKRKKRKSVVLGRKRRQQASSVRSRDSSIANGTATSQDAQDMHDPDMGEDDPAAEVSESLDVDDRSQGEQQILQSAAELPRFRSNRRRDQLSVPTSPVNQERGEEEGDTTYVENSSPEPVTPAAKRRKTGVQRKRRKSDTTEKVEGRNKTKGSSFPVVTHRMTNLQALPTIPEDDHEDDSSSYDANEALLARFPDRTQPNAVDVLAQLCRETIESAAEKMEGSSASIASRAATKRKRTALEAFGEGLDQRLFDMSEAVEHRTTLEARLRRSKREKAELQARWIEIRRQRDELALEADAIRRQNWENQEQGKRQWEISELARSIEVEVEQSGSEEPDLEFMLRFVAGNVSRIGVKGGILNRVKSFNGQLERMVAVLEKR